MGTVGVRIGHNDDLVIVGILKGKICTNPRSNRINHGVDFFVLENVSHLSLGSIDNLTAQGQDGLELTVTALLGRSTGRVSLDQIEFVLGWILGLGRSQLTRQQALIFFIFLAVSAFVTRLAGCFPSVSGLDSLADKVRSQLTIFQEEESQLVRNDRVHGWTSQRAAQLVLGLAFKLQVRLRDQDGQDSSQTFAVVRSFQILVLFLEQAGLSGIVVHGLGNCGLEPRLVGTAVLGADVIDKGQDIICVAVVVLESHLDLEAALLALEIEDRSQGFLVFIEIADKVFNPVFIVKLYFFASPRIGQ